MVWYFTCIEGLITEWVPSDGQEIYGVCYTPTGVPCVTGGQWEARTLLSVKEWVGVEREAECLGPGVVGEDTGNLHNKGHDNEWESFQKLLYSFHLLIK